MPDDEVTPVFSKPEGSVLDGSAPSVVAPGYREVAGAAVATQHCALAGCRVVLLGSGPALDMFGGVLADQGAEVIRIEPPNGDQRRSVGPGARVGHGSERLAQRGR